MQRLFTKKYSDEEVAALLKVICPDDEKEQFKFSPSTFQANNDINKFSKKSKQLVLDALFKAVDRMHARVEAYQKHEKEHPNIEKQVMELTNLFGDEKVNNANAIIVATLDLAKKFGGTEKANLLATQYNLKLPNHSHSAKK